MELYAWVAPTIADQLPTNGGATAVRPTNADRRPLTLAKFQYGYIIRYRMFRDFQRTLERPDRIPYEKVIANLVWIPTYHTYAWVERRRVVPCGDARYLESYNYKYYYFT